ncbi:restriction endonuclease subunit S [Paludifilum halophilum]|uniref:Type I restriction modification DNA specificity domain-containing protein n=1 Tax=Paludifilum halophilum TaxID=1642702 RepID=A0A235B336_9BACL|nr:restriction endonuclease subunit S [Paludifilum halophilum]OYD06728.1 hypothetical protein CHM34_14210 [Paludifilum halophilum]
MKRFKLSNVLSLVSRPENVQPDKTYKLLGVHWYAKGLYIKDVRKGHEIKAKKLYKVEKGDFVYNRLFAWKGSFGLATEEVAGCYVSNEFPCFQFSNSDPEYILWLFKDEEMWDRCSELSKGSTSISRKRLKVEKLLSLDVPLPDLQQQNTLSEYFQAVESTVHILKGQLNERSKIITDLRQSILNQAVQGKLVPQDPNDKPASVLLEKIKEEKDRLVKEKKIRKQKVLPLIEEEEIPYEIPEGWEWVRFGDVCRIVSNLVDPKEFLFLVHVAPNHIEKSTGKLIDLELVSEAGLRSKKHKFNPGQIIYSKIRPNLSKLTIVDFEGVCSADMYPIDVFINNKYVANYMLSSYFINLVTKNDNRVAMPKVNQDELNKVIVPLPPLKEQKRIVAKVDQLLSLCDQLEEQLKVSEQNTEKLLQAVLHEAFQSEETKEAVEV